MPYFKAELSDIIPPLITLSRPTLRSPVQAVQLLTWLGVSYDWKSYWGKCPTCFIYVSRNVVFNIYILTVVICVNGSNLTHITLWCGSFSARMLFH